MIVVLICYYYDYNDPIHPVSSCCQDSLALLETNQSLTMHLQIHKISTLQKLVLTKISTYTEN